MDILYYILFGIIFGILLTIYTLRYYRNYCFKKKLIKAKKSEQKAIKFLENQGFEIIGIQKEQDYKLLIDNKPYTVTVKADMIVKKGSNIYVAEVKTGDKATSPKYANTRRQLLEYFMVYRPHGLILVDMEKQKLRTVEYSIINNNKIAYFKQVILYLILICIGFVVGFLTRGG